MNKKYMCIAHTTWQGRVVRPDDKKPVIVTVQVNKSGRTILDDNPCWKEMPSPEKVASEAPKPEALKDKK